jgi:hypothetical protein
VGGAHAQLRAGLLVGLWDLAREDEARPAWLIWLAPVHTHAHTHHVCLCTCISQNVLTQEDTWPSGASHAQTLIHGMSTMWQLHSLVQVLTCFMCGADLFTCVHGEGHMWLHCTQMLAFTGVINMAVRYIHRHAQAQHRCTHVNACWMAP